MVTFSHKTSLILIKNVCPVLYKKSITPNFIQILASPLPHLGPACGCQWEGAVAPFRCPHSHHLVLRMPLALPGLKLWFGGTHPASVPHSQQKPSWPHLFRQSSGWLTHGLGHHRPSASDLLLLGLQVHLMQASFLLFCFFQAVDIYSHPSPLQADTHWTFPVALLNPHSLAWGTEGPTPHATCSQAGSRIWHPDNFLWRNSFPASRLVSSYKWWARDAVPF